MRKYYPYPKRDPIKNYFPLPNELFGLGLSANAIALYAFLMRMENRKDYSIVLGYKEIGKALRMSKNTVAKYVTELVEAGLIEVERTHIYMHDGSKYNGKLHYRVLPIQGAIDEKLKRDLDRLSQDTARYEARKALAQLPPLPEDTGVF